jgi:hypothetical protein
MDMHDLKSLKKLIRENGPTAALPRNLSDDWLKFIATEIVGSEISKGDQIARPPSAAVMIVNLLLVLKCEETGDESPMEHFGRYMWFYQYSIYKEIVERHVGIRTANYHLDNFFPEMD